MKTLMVVLLVWLFVSFPVGFMLGKVLRNCSGKDIE